MSDLTGGLDSRLVVAAVSAAGLPPAVTVNGSATDPDFRIASEVARRMCFPLVHFDPVRAPTGAWDPAVREELHGKDRRRTGFHLDPAASGDASAAATQFRRAHGRGGRDFVRYHPWGQEFLNVGRRSGPVAPARLSLLPGSEAALGPDGVRFSADAASGDWRTARGPLHIRTRPEPQHTATRRRSPVEIDGSHLLVPLCCVCVDADRRTAPVRWIPVRRAFCSVAHAPDDPTSASGRPHALSAARRGANALRWYCGTSSARDASPRSAPSRS